MYGLSALPICGLASASLFCGVTWEGTGGCTKANQMGLSGAERVLLQGIHLICDEKVAWPGSFLLAHREAAMRNQLRCDRSPDNSTSCCEWKSVSRTVTLEQL
jgi:hypothetical protein